MASKTTSGVLTSVEIFYQDNHSNPQKGDFVFAYRITIENQNTFSIKLLNRHWYIFDSDGTVRQVEGEGVVGQQPVLEPNEAYEYVSGCNLNTSIGKMAGTYLMERLLDGKQFKVQIPEFVMIAPYRLN